MKYVKKFDIFKESQVSNQPISPSEISITSEFSGEQRNVNTYDSEPKDYKYSKPIEYNIISHQRKLQDYLLSNLQR